MSPTQDWAARYVSMPSIGAAPVRLSSVSCRHGTSEPGCSDLTSAFRPDQQPVPGLTAVDPYLILIPVPHQLRFRLAYLW